MSQLAGSASALFSLACVAGASWATATGTARATEASAAAVSNPSVERILFTSLVWFLTGLRGRRRSRCCKFSVRIRCIRAVRSNPGEHRVAEGHGGLAVAGRVGNHRAAALPDFKQLSGVQRIQNRL